MLCLFLGEFFLLTFRYDALTLLERPQSDWFSWLAYSGYALKAAAVFGAAMLLALGPRLRTYYQSLRICESDHLVMHLLLMQLIIYGVFFGLTDTIFGQSGLVRNTSLFVFTSWLASLCFVVGLSFLTFAPSSFWRKFVVQERRSIVMAILVALCSLAIALSAQQLWEPLSELTFVTAATLLELVYHEVVQDSGEFLLGTPTFVVKIAAACSGYEGIGLVVVLTGFYLSSFRREFRFPQAFWLFPIGIVAIWGFNAVRIVVLIIIGTEFSPAVAVGGFHSQAGWIAFLFVTFGLLTISYRLDFFTQRIRPQKIRSENVSTVFLMPLAALLSMTLLTSALAANFDWFYPIRVVVTATVLVLLWHHFKLQRFLVRPLKLSFVPILAGTLVFFVWLILVPEDPEGDAIFRAELSLVSTSVFYGWLILRVVGSVITVPLAEELAFRGFVMERLTKISGTKGLRLEFSWLALVASSVLFGVLHDAWLAGIAAGIIYGLVRYYRNNLTDCVVAHGVTNFLLFLFAYNTGAWSVL